MSRQLIWCLLLLSCFALLFGHEGHQDTKENQKQEMVTPSPELPPSVKHIGGRPLNWTQWIGSFHFIFLHFPIALIIMTGISELLLIWCQRPIFDYASRFMIIAAAVFAIPTASLGLIYSYTSSYSGLLADFIWWHMWAGITTTVLAIFVAIIRQYLGVGKIYYISLFILFLLVNITGYLGARMTFGPYHMQPPI